MDDEGTLLLGDLNIDLNKLIDISKDKMREYFRTRAEEQASKIIDNWKNEEIYPYAGEPKNPVEIVERQVFDVLALNVNSYLPDFDTSSSKSKRFSFSLLKEALESSPSSLKRIIQDVLNLPIEKQEELASLLDRTTLEAIINASKVVADRLNFLEGLEILVFDPNTKQQLLERQHLHKIISEYTWLFGEKYNLTVSDRSLTSVLKKHLDLAEKELADDSSVVRENGSKGIIDLMFSKRVPELSINVQS